jgi:serine/threonine-protein kinase
VYGFGVILYEALTGLLPYSADNFAELAAKVITSEPTPPRQIHPEIPERLEEVVLWAMKKRREERAPNLSVLIDALLPFTAPAEGSASLSSPRLPLVEGRGSAREQSDEVPRPPLSSTPAPFAPGLRLDEHKNWDAVLDRSQRERREMEERVTALIAGTMYEGRRKSNQGRGLWMAVGGALAAVVVGVVLATVTRGGDSPPEGAEPAPKTATGPATVADKPEQSAAQGAGSAPPAVAPPAPLEPAAPETMKPAASTQVESVQMPRFNSAAADAAVKPGAQRAWSKPNVRPTFSGPSGEPPSPPPLMITPAPPPEPVDLPAPVVAPPPPRDDPTDPVDVNPFEAEGAEPVETYRAGKPREDEF